MTGRICIDQFSRLLISSADVSLVHGYVAISTVDSCSHIKNSIQIVPGTTIVDWAECAPTASRVLEAAFYGSSTVWSIRVWAAMRK
uniref:U2266t n=1 Tax=Mycobacterium leprae TaxID=1769 RepID=Q50055_MYCLR|nr:u2266t [Mycobacterium leprae]